MAYIGNSPANVGNYQIVDTIAGSFNASSTSFALASGGITITPAKSGQLLVAINGVLQQPDDTGTNGFKVSGSNVVFSSPPASGDTFWAVYQGQNVDIGTPSDDVVGVAQLSATGTASSSTFLRGDNAWVALSTDANTTTKGLYEHAHTISVNYSITSGNNAITAGPITINTGISVTVPTGSAWVIV